MRELVICALLMWATSSTAAAQQSSWSTSRERPALWQIISVDRTGEPLWPYGAEDVAGDGLSAFQPDEAASDVRSVYADATADRLWLRAYLASGATPSALLSTFFFLDTDARTDTGGPAQGQAIDPSLSGDPTAGGYERVFGVRGDGSAIGAFSWDAAQRSWVALTARAGELRTEAGRARDPLLLGAPEHGYVQLDALHALASVSASCGARIFVRTRSAGATPRAFGDDDRTAVACRAQADVYGDPNVLRSASCRADNECPSSGRCRDGVCLWAYECTAASDCPSGQSCSNNQCVLTPGRACSAAAECGGLLCESGACVACSESGTRACGGGLACSPDGRCVDPGRFVPRDGEGIGEVQGGAFSCAAGPRASGGALGLMLLSASLLWLRRRKSQPGVVKQARWSR